MKGKRAKWRKRGTKSKQKEKGMNKGERNSNKGKRGKKGEGGKGELIKLKINNRSEKKRKKTELNED